MGRWVRFLTGRGQEGSANSSHIHLMFHHPFSSISKGSTSHPCPLTHGPLFKETNNNNNNNLGSQTRAREAMMGADPQAAMPGW